MVAWLQRRSLSLRRVLNVKELSKFLMKLLKEVLFITARKPKSSGSVVLICIRFVINYVFKFLNYPVSKLRHLQSSPFIAGSVGTSN